MRTAHIVSLESLAGVEILYKDYIRESSNSSLNITISPTNKMNTFIKNELELHSKIFFYKKLGKLHLPKISLIRNYNFKHILKKNNSEIVINWNRLKADVTIPSEVKSVYYEHSAAWYDHCPKAATKILQRADGIIAVSQAAKKVIELKYGKELSKKIVVNNNPLPISRVHLAHKPPAKEKLTLGFVGRFMPVKAPWIILHSLKLLREQGYEADAILMGNGPLLEEMKHLANSLGIEKYCLFTGSVSDPTPYYQKIKYLIISSYCEPFGLIALEGINFGCIPLYNDVDGVGESFRSYSQDLSLSPVLGEKENLELKGFFPKDIKVVLDRNTSTLISPKTPNPIDILNKITALERNESRYEIILSELQTLVLEEHQFDKYLERQYNYLERILHDQ